MCQFPVVQVHPNDMVSFSHTLFSPFFEYVAKGRGLRGHPLKAEFGAPNSLLAKRERQRGGYAGAGLQWLSAESKHRRMSHKSAVFLLRRSISFT